MGSVDRKSCGLAHRLWRGDSGVGALQVLLLAVSVVGLHFAGQLVTLRTETARYYYLWRPADAAARVADVVGLALLITLTVVALDGIAHRLLKNVWLERSRRLFGHVFLLALVSGLLAVPVPLAVNHPRAFTVLWVAAAGVVGFSLGWPYSPLVRWGRWVALGAFPFVLAGFGWMTTWTIWHDPPKTPELNPLVAHDSTAQPPADPPSPVFLFVFDEWAAGRTRPCGEFRSGLANMAQLAETAIQFRQARSPFYSSEWAMPRLLFQNDLRFYRADGRIIWQTPTGPVASPEMPSLFSMARQKGYVTCLAGWYFPYQRFFGEQLDYCGPIGSYYNRGEGLLDEMSHAALVALSNMTDPLSRRVWGPIEKRVNAHRRWQIEQSLEREILRIIDGAPPKTMAVFHIPLPHQPFVFDEDGSYRTVYDADSAEGYLRNLHYADCVLGKCLGRLRTAKKFDPALILVTSNHAWREEPEPDYRPGPDWKRRVPLLIKLPGQQDTRRIDHPVETNRLAPLIHAVLSGTIEPGALDKAIDEVVAEPDE